MPMPTPGADESKDDFLSRCHSALADEFEDSAQRHAVCLSQWEDDRASAGAPERRTLAFARDTELRVTKSGNGSMISGYAIVYDTPSEQLGGGLFPAFRETIKPEAIARTFREQIDVRAFWNHDPGQVLGRMTAGTLRMRSDDRGLRVEIDPPTWATNILESIQRRDVTGMSFAFSTIKDDWPDESTRHIFDMRVHEVSVVSMPAYAATDVSVAQRSLAAWRTRNKVMCPDPNELAEQHPICRNQSPSLAMRQRMLRQSMS